MALMLAGLSIRADLAGVSSVVRVLGLQERCYRCLLHLCHSAGLPVETLRSMWARLVLKWFISVRLNQRLVVIDDGLKVAKEGRKFAHYRIPILTADLDTTREQLDRFYLSANFADFRFCVPHHLEHLIP
jgi:hypothetical protein